jgi:hypothetical protein
LRSTATKYCYFTIIANEKSNAKKPIAETAKAARQKDGAAFVEAKAIGETYLNTNGKCAEAANSNNKTFLLSVLSRLWEVDHVLDFRQPQAVWMRIMYNSAIVTNTSMLYTCRSSSDNNVVVARDKVLPTDSDTALKVTDERLERTFPGSLPSHFLELRYLVNIDIHDAGNACRETIATLIVFFEFCLINWDHILLRSKATQGRRL